MAGKEYTSNQNKTEEAPEALINGQQDPGVGITIVERSKISNLVSRSSSPAKRRASAMENELGGLTNEEPKAKNVSSPGSSSVAGSESSSRKIVDSPLSQDMCTSTTAANKPPEVAESPPLLDDQVRQVMALHAQEYNDSQKLYIISNTWLERVFARTSEGQSGGTFKKGALEGDIGPVDNSDIVMPGMQEDLKTVNGEAFIALKPDLRVGEDFEILPEEAWKLIMSWYGLAEGSPIVVRFAHDTSPQGAISQNIQCELHPPIFTLRKLSPVDTGTTSQVLKEKNLNAPKLLASRNELVQTFLRRIKEEVGVEMKKKVRMWRILDFAQTEQDNSGKSGILTPATSRSASPNPSTYNNRSVTPLLVDKSSFTAMVEGLHGELLDVRDETMNEKYNGHLKLDTLGLATDQILVIEEQSGALDAEHYVSDSTRKTTEKNGIAVTVTSDDGKVVQMDKALPQGQPGRSSSALSGPITREYSRRNGRTKGTIGLVNLGNTCYMNSALQCIRSVEELSMYFLRQEYKNDLNMDNPLGYNGAIAKAYAGLLASIYADSAASSFAPKNFKTTLSRCQPMFSGYGQQDSQEFLSFLVDGLHEDLNRVIKKPYIENPESDDNTVNDPEAIRELGEKFRKNHCARNDSVAMDLFNGFYKNTMICPACSKVSITFDPFSLLTLQLPVESSWQHTVYYAPLRGRPVKVEVDTERNSTIRQLKEYVAKRIPNLRPERLMCAEVYSHKFFKTFTDSQILSDCNIQPRDEMVLYELETEPTNFPPKKKKSNNVRSPFVYHNVSSEEDIPEDESALADKMIIPLFHSIVKEFQGRVRHLVLWPSFIILTREEAKDYDSILRKVIAKVATMTTKDILKEDDYDGYSSSTSEEVMKRQTGDDSSLGSENRPFMHSIDGNGSMVDISMADADDGKRGIKTDNELDDPHSNEDRHVPNVLKPGTFIPPRFRTLFEMKYFRSNRELVPTTFNQFDTNYGNYDTIFSRVQRLPSRRSSPQSNISRRSTSSASEDFDNVPEFSHNNRRDTNGDEDTDDDSVPSHGVHSHDTSTSKYFEKRKTGNIYYSGAQQRENLDDLADEKPMLVRLGEAIMLEWEPDGYNALFEGKGFDDMHGRDTWTVMEELIDTELQEKKSKRAARRRAGISLEDCFVETSKGEILSEENAWYCNRCKELRRASKTLDIWTLPNILVIHLKRFSASRGYRDKVDVLVDFPIEGLDLSDRVSLKADNEMIYDLFAVDNHYGVLGGGHYTAFAQNFFDKKWYEYNDSSVGLRNKEAVVSSAAYLLFYRRRSDKPLGPPYLQKIVREAYEEISRSPESSRAQSPLGEGRRLDDFSRNGSSGALAGAGAGAALLPRGAGSVGAMLAKNGDGIDLDNEVDADTALPPYEDEGISMDTELNYGTENALVPLDAQYNPRQQHFDEWNFSNADELGVRVGSDGGLSDGTATDVAAPGSNIGDDLQDRIMADFSNEDPEGRTTRQSPVIGQSPMDELPDLIGDDGAIRVNPAIDEVDDPVAEVRIDDKDVFKPIGE